MKKMKLIYIAGPFTGIDSFEIDANIRAAEDKAYGIILNYSNCAVLCPHSLGRNFVGTMTPEYWYEATMEMLRRCDAVMTCGFWTESKGAVAEVNEAGRLGIPVFTGFPAFNFWMKAQ